MENYLLKFVIRWKWLVILALIFGSLTGFFSLAVHRVVDDFVPSYATLMSDRLKLRTSFQRVHYAFPYKIVLDGLKIFDKQAGTQAMLEVPRLTLEFSFPLFSSHGKICLSQITLGRMKIRAPALSRYMMQHGRLMLAEFKAKPNIDMGIHVSDAQLFLFRDGRVVVPIVFNMDLSFGRGKFLGKLKDRYSFLQFWGDWRGNSLDWKGFMFYDGPLTPKPLYVMDINGTLHVKDQGITLEKLSFSFNEDSVLASGRFFLDGMPKFESAITYRRQVKRVNAKNPLRNIEANLQGQINGGNIMARGSIDFDLFSDAKLNMPWQKVRLTFQDLGVRVLNDELLQLKIKQAQARVASPGHEYKISFENFMAVMRQSKSAQFMMTSSAQLWGGRSQERVLLDTASSPWQVEAHGQFDEIDINRSGEALTCFNNDHGYASGRFDIQAPRKSSLSGNLSIRDGVFPDLSSSPWSVSKICQMPSLDHLSGVTLLLHFKFEPQGMELKDIQLRTDDLSLKGFFSLDSHDFVSSRISILFSQKLLNESPVGQKTIQLVPGAWELPFEFQFSGERRRMNFQWNDSTLKRKVENRLPGFIERSIQRQVDKKVSAE